jgi:hypothetical protein
MAMALTFRSAVVGAAPAARLLQAKSANRVSATVKVRIKLIRHLDGKLTKITILPGLGRWCVRACVRGVRACVRVEGGRVWSIALLLAPFSSLGLYFSSCIRHC